LFFFDNFKNLQSPPLRTREREKEKEKERKSFETYSKICHSLFGLTLPSSSNLGVVGWQWCNNTTQVPSSNHNTNSKKKFKNSSPKEI
jgi:hypothetical protein